MAVPTIVAVAALMIELQGVIRLEAAPVDLAHSTDAVANIQFPAAALLNRREALFPASVMVLSSPSSSSLVRRRKETRMA